MRGEFSGTTTSFGHDGAAECVISWSAGKYLPYEIIVYYFTLLKKKFVTQSRTGLQIYEGHDDQLNRPGPMA
jgi:hypothetical protein